MRHATQSSRCQLGHMSMPRPGLGSGAPAACGACGRLMLSPRFAAQRMRESGACAGARLPLVPPQRGPRRAAAAPDDSSGSPCAPSAAPGEQVPLAAQVGGADESFATSAGVIQPVDEADAKFDSLGETTEGSLHFVQRLQRAGVPCLFGLDSLQDVVNADTGALVAAVQEVLDCIDAPVDVAASRPERAVFCNRTLNLRGIKAIGYDLDYTLLHYSVDAWEGRAYAYGLEALRDMGLPVDGLAFESSLVIRGLILDKELGTLLKVDRFGLVKRAMHGTRMLGWQDIRDAYGREVVNLRHEGRYLFLNTLFSVSEAVLYCQLVDRLDAGELGSYTGGPQLTYQGLYKLVAKALYRTHVEGRLKAEIIADPGRFCELDPDMARTLLDQRDSGKLLILITNSDYRYTSQLMSFAYDRFLPAGMTWRDLFDMVIVQARKPDFFSHSSALFKIVSDDGLLRPCHLAERGGLYCGGSARVVEKALGVEGDELLYVGDHIYTDAALAKINFRWRTALILRELEDEVVALARGRTHRARLMELVTKKEAIGALFDHLRLARQRHSAGRAPGVGGRSPSQSGSAGSASARPTRASGSPSGSGSSSDSSSSSSSNRMSAAAHLAGSDGGGFGDDAALNETLGQLLVVLDALDAQIGPLLEQDGAHFNQRWGYLSRAGLNDRSQMSRQIDKYADIVTSRVSNLLAYTPYGYFRPPSQSLAHDRGVEGLDSASGGGAAGGDASSGEASRPAAR